MKTKTDLETINTVYFNYNHILGYTPGGLTFTYGKAFYKRIKGGSSTCYEVVHYSAKVDIESLLKFYYRFEAHLKFIVVKYNLRVTTSNKILYSKVFYLIQFPFINSESSTTAIANIIQIERRNYSLNLMW